MLAKATRFGSLFMPGLLACEKSNMARGVLPYDAGPRPRPGAVALATGSEDEIESLVGGRETPLSWISDTVATPAIPEGPPSTSLLLHRASQQAFFLLRSMVIRFIVA